MKERFRNIRFVAAATLVLVLVAIAAEVTYYSDIEWKYRTSRLDRTLIAREKKASFLLTSLENDLRSGKNPSGLFTSNSGTEGRQEGMILLVYRADTLIYWSENSVTFPQIYDNALETHKPVFLSNGWFIPVQRSFGGYDLLALITVYRQYPIENNLLRSGFPASFRLPHEARISFEPDESPFHVKGREDEFHFSVVFPQNKPNTFFIVVPVLLWLVVFIILLRLVNLASYRISDSLPGPARLAVLVSAQASVYAVLLLTRLPGSVSSTELFSPFLYTFGNIIPSIGHLALLSIMTASGLSFYFWNDRAVPSAEATGKHALVKPAILMASGFLLFLLAGILFSDIILNSAINFKAYKILDIRFMSLAAYLTVLLMLSLPVILFLRASTLMTGLHGRRILAVTGIASLVIPVAWLAGLECTRGGIVFIMLTAVAVLLWRRSGFSIIALMWVIAALTGIFSTAMIMKYSVIREDRNMKVMAISLASDNDMVAESMLMDLWPELEKDSALGVMMKHESFSPSDINNVYRYLQGRYFTGYWENFDLNIIICRDDSPLRIPDAESYASNCFLYFDERIKNEGDTITGTGFWFMQNQGGRAYYLSRLFYRSSPFLTNGLFIELIGHIDSYQAGYPELLLDATHQRFPRLRGISYAKYSGSRLVMRSGDFPYDNQTEVTGPEGEYRTVAAGNYRHLYYRRGDMTLVVTTQAATMLDSVITFAYLFVTVLLFSFLLLMLFTRQPAGLLRSDTFRRRLQLAFATVLSIAFTIIIAGALFMSTKQFRENHTKIIREKTVSVSIELEHKLADQAVLTADWNAEDYRSLDELLVKFSNVFMTDINLYSPSGKLLATSRPEVFSRRLDGNMIDPVAFGTLSGTGKTEYIGDEEIGSLTYLSSYMPFYNDQGTMLAYVNLPYFEMQNILTGEISNLVVTLVNFTLLLMVFMMWFAVFLSRRITSPLTLIRVAMASVGYGKKNQYINYRGTDEIGELVKQYNRMIDELNESALKLARSERELAWREMARQIAHEIKNPLTPMKLNVQQLFRWWNDKVPDFETRIRKFTNNQIEYIDNLSNIASAFSYFARLPGAEPAEVDVIAQLKTTTGIFGNAENAVVTLDTGTLRRAVIMADREHLNGIFSNLIKNAIQAIPLGRKGVILIKVSASNDQVRVRISDNGCGIPDELRPRMFTPNFTTKSSGMGLGLSIVKRYVETAGGNITYESELNVGTAFIIDFPLLFTEEKEAKGSGDKID